MGLKEGMEIDCQAVKNLENFHWKREYEKVGAWDKEKIRLEKVKNLIESLDNRVEAVVVGFGAGHTEFITAHPEEAGKPDLRVQTKQGEVLVLLIEVTGTETMRGNTYWLRPDKLTYARNHPDEDVWFILHYAKPQENFVFIKPISEHQYKIVNQEIRGSIEHYVEFENGSPSVKSQAEFLQYLTQRVDSILAV
jgi:hypothetical protein